MKLRGIRGAISACMIFFDVTAFVLATYRTVRSILENRRNGLKIKGSSNDILFAQGKSFMEFITANASHLLWLCRTFVYGVRYYFLLRVLLQLTEHLGPSSCFLPFPWRWTLWDPLWLQPRPNLTECSPASQVVLHPYDERLQASVRSSCKESN